MEQYHNSWPILFKRDVHSWRSSICAVVWEGWDTGSAGWKCTTLVFRYRERVETYVEHYDL